MLKAAETGGDTTKKAQCAKYREIAAKLGYKEEDIPDDVRNGRMQRFDDVLNFTLRAINQKKSNRKDNYDLDRLSRYMKDLIRKNIKFACDLVEYWLKTEKKGKLEESMNRPLYYKVRALLNDISQIGERRFLKMLRDTRLRIPVKDCSRVSVEEIETLLLNVMTSNLHEETGI